MSTARDRLAHWTAAQWDEHVLASIVLLTAFNSDGVPIESLAATLGETPVLMEEEHAQARQVVYAIERLCDAGRITMGQSLSRVVVKAVPQES